MTVLAGLLTVGPAGEGFFTGPSHGPAGKRAYGGLLAAQAFVAACQTVPADRAPTAVHVQYLRAGDAGEQATYQVEEVHDGRTTSSRRVLGRQGGRLLVSVTVLFATPAPGPQHGDRGPLDDPEQLPRTGPIGPAPGLPLDEIDIRITDIKDSDDPAGGNGFVRRMWWRVTAPLPADSRLHAAMALYVTDVYGVDPVLAVHGHSMTDRSHHAATTDASMWFHGNIIADGWNVLVAQSPVAGRGRGLMTAGLFGVDGTRIATLVHEGQAVARD